MARITGANKWKRRLQRLRGPHLVRHVTQAIFASAEDLAVDAATSITTGATSGKGHVPSSPGEPPNADTHVLSNNIEATSTGPLKAETSSNAPYGTAQEFGDESLGLPERPYMRPAAKKNRPKARRRVVAAVNKVVATSGG